MNNEEEGIPDIWRDVRGVWYRTFDRWLGEPQLPVAEAPEAPVFHYEPKSKRLKIINRNYF